MSRKTVIGEWRGTTQEMTVGGETVDVCARGIRRAFGIKVIKPDMIYRFEITPLRPVKMKLPKGLVVGSRVRVVNDCGEYSVTHNGTEWVVKQVCGDMIGVWNTAWPSGFTIRASAVEVIK